MTVPYNKNKPAVNAIYNSIEGFAFSLNATTPNTQIDIEAGSCVDSSDTFDINVGNYRGTGVDANQTITLDATYVGVNGIDTGTLAATKMYALHAIYSTNESVPAGYILSLSATAPTMPFNYNLSRLIGFQPTDASAHFLPTIVCGNGNFRKYVYETSRATAVTAGTATSQTAVDLSNLVPLPDTTRMVSLKTTFTPNAAADTVALRAFGAAGDTFVAAGQVASVALISQFEIPAILDSGVPKISYAVSTASAAVAINVVGFDVYL